VAAVFYLSPAWGYLDAFDAQDSAAIHGQVQAQRQDAPQFAALAGYLRRHPGGRVFAGVPADWGQSFKVGSVPMYRYLASLDIDEVGDTLRTAALMSQPEYDLDEANPGDYAVFGIRYLLLPVTRAPAPPAGAVRILRTRLFVLYELPGHSYLRVADTVGTITANRADIGTRTLPYLQSPLPGRDQYLSVAFAGAPPPAPTRPGLRGTSGLRGDVRASRRAGWSRRAGRDGPGRARRPGPRHRDRLGAAAPPGRRDAQRVVRPRLVGHGRRPPGRGPDGDARPAGRRRPPGTHRIACRYTGFGWYPQLLVLAAAVLSTVAIIASRRRRTSPPPASNNRSE
jgi:hypothetical protein